MRDLMDSIRQVTAKGLLSGHSIDVGEPSFSCIAIALNKEELGEFTKRGFVAVFTPERHKINCWVLIRDYSDVPASVKL